MPENVRGTVSMPDSVGSGTEREWESLPGWRASWAENSKMGRCLDLSLPRRKP